MVVLAHRMLRCALSCDRISKEVKTELGAKPVDITLVAVEIAVRMRMQYDCISLSLDIAADRALAPSSFQVTALHE